MSRDVLTVGSTMRIPLLYRGEYSQWVEWFMNCLEEQTDGEAIINLIKNGDQPLPRVTQVSIAGTTSTEQPSLKDKSMWSDQEKRVQKIDRLARSLLIQGLPNDIYSLIDSNNTAKDLWDALARHMLGSEYGEQDRKAAVFESKFKTLEYYDNSTTYGLFVNNDDEQEIFHDAIDYASENFIENHIDTQKDYDKSDVDHNDSKEKDQLVDKLIRKFNKKIVKCQKHIEKSNQQSIDFENQNKDLQDKYDVLKNQTTTFKMNNNELNEQMKELIEKNNDLRAQMKVLKDQLRVKHVVIDTHVECQEKYAKLEAERYEYMIRYSAYFDNYKQHRKQIADQQVLKGISFENPRYFEKAKDLRPTLYDEKVIGLGYTSMFLTHSDEALEIKKFKRSRENKIKFAYDYGNLNASYVNEKINLEDDYFQEIINPD
nr:hypothetical protein [Tanacetum cinerariifolium]